MTSFQRCVSPFPNVFSSESCQCNGSEQAAPELHATLPVLPQDAIPEVSVYFEEAWGNRTRIDYGSGMELNFLCWLSVACSQTFSFRITDAKC